MSSAAGAAAAYEELLVLLQDSFISSCCELAICACVLYEHLITLRKEVDLVWGHKLTGPNAIFYVNRYALLLWAAVNIVSLFPWDTPSRCEAVLLLKFVAQVLLLSLWAVFSGLRVFAVSGRHWPLALLTVALGLVPVALNIHSLTKTSYASVVALPVLGHVCENISYITSDWGILLSIASTIASDVLVLIATWYNTYHIKRDARHANVNATVVTLLLRDGTIYFLFLLVLNVIAILLDTQTAYVYILYFTAPISSILISRFLLNLRHIYYAPSSAPYALSGSTSTSAGAGATSTNMSDMQFAPGPGMPDVYVGHMGAPLAHGAFRLSALYERPRSPVKVDVELPLGGGRAAQRELSEDLDDGEVYKAVWQVSANPLAAGIVSPREEVELRDLESRLRYM